MTSIGSLRFQNGSMKMVLSIVLITLAALVSLPLITVMIIAKTSLTSLASSAIDSLYQGPIAEGDTYDWGNCTYWAALLRKQAGHAIPNSWGNAATWARRASADGYLVDHNPSVGSIMQIATVDHGLGHVAYVTAINPLNGSWTVSEMNVKGYDIVDSQTFPAGAAAQFSFIHNRIL